MKNITIMISIAFAVINPLKSFTQSINPKVSTIINGPNSECGNAIVSDKDGNYYITGYLQNGAVIGNEEVKVNGNTDIFIAKYNNNDKCLWYKTFGGGKRDPMLANEMGCLLHLDGNNDLVVSGFFSGIAIIDSTKLISNGDDDIFILKISPSGELLWVNQIGGTLQDKPLGMELDSSGILYLLGTYNSQISFGEIKLNQEGINSFICKIDYSNGNILGGFSTSQVDGFKGEKIKLDKKRDLIIVGNCESIDHTQASITVLKIDCDGNLKWINSYPFHGLANIKSLALNLQGEIFLVGYFDKSLNTKKTTLVSGGNVSVFILKIGSESNLIEAKSYGGIINDEALGIINNGVTMFLFGKHSGELNISENEHIKTDFPDYFLANLNNNASLTSVINLGLSDSQKIKGVDGRNTNSLYLTGLTRNAKLNNEGKDECLKVNVQNLSSIFHSINSTQQSNNLTITPNPVAERFFIINENNTRTWYTVKIINAQGIEQLSFSESSDGYDISSLKPGIFIVQVYDYNGAVISMPLIKK